MIILIWQKTKHLLKLFHMNKITTKVSHSTPFCIVGLLWQAFVHGNYDGLRFQAVLPDLRFNLTYGLEQLGWNSEKWDFNKYYKLLQPALQMK